MKSSDPFDCCKVLLSKDFDDISVTSVIHCSVLNSLISSTGNLPPEEKALLVLDSHLDRTRSCFKELLSVFHSVITSPITTRTRSSIAMLRTLSHVFEHMRTANNRSDFVNDEETLFNEVLNWIRSDQLWLTVNVSVIDGVRRVLSVLHKTVHDSRATALLVALLRHPFPTVRRRVAEELSLSSDVLSLTVWDEEPGIALDNEVRVICASFDVNYDSLLPIVIPQSKYMNSGEGKTQSTWL